MTGQQPYPRHRPTQGNEQVSRIVVGVAPYVLLTFATALTPLLDQGGRRSVLIAYVLAAVIAAWMLWMYTLHPAWRGRPRIMGVFVTVLLALTALTVLSYPWFGFFSFTGYFYVFALLPPWRKRMIGVGVVAVLAGVSQAGGLRPATTGHLTVLFGAIAVNAVVACAFTWVDHVNDMEHERSERAAAEIAEANRRLEATLSENVGLHEQLLVQAREAGVLDERQRMAREIHDTLAQGLTGIITQLQAAEQAGQDPVERRRHFDAAVMLARESLTEARRSVHALRPEPLETALLGEALTGVAQRWSELNGVPAQVTMTGTARPVGHDAESALLRTAQEALANVAKHAAATRIGLTLSYMDDEVILDVRDDGRGFDPVQAARHCTGPGGFGLVAMRQRIEGLSGSLQVESEPGVGTAISASVPVPSARIPARAGGAQVDRSPVDSPLADSAAHEPARR
jgi:signal transduction histidine kinase